MSSEATGVFVPPKFDLNGRKQLWFYRTGRDQVDHFGNGILSGALVVGPILAGGMIL